MKKIISIILVLTLLLMSVSCGEFVETGGGKRPDDEQENTGGTENDADDSDALANDPTAFTVSLRDEDGWYYPKERDNVIAQWTDGFSFHTAKFGKDGVARIKGLDGDFTVTLKNLPDKYVYNPNAYTARNVDGERSVVIDIHAPIRTRGEGTGPYDSIKIKELGVYKAELKGAGREHAVYYEYAPTEQGTYAVETWLSTAEGEYNPSAIVFTPNAAYKKELYTIHDGGYSDGYTQNIKYIIEIAKENISSGGGGAAVYTFAIYVDAKKDNFPINVDFAVTRNGSFSLEHENKTLIIPDVPLEQMKDYDPSEYVWSWAETETKGAEGRFEFDGKMFKLWSKEDGGDGYYHLYNSETGEYGEILYAKISLPHRFTAESFTTIEYAGNSALTVYANQNHKLFIEGIETLIRDPYRDNPNSPNATHGSYFCLRDCPCREKLRNCTGVCGESCKTCLEGCRNLPDAVVATMIKGPFYCSTDCPCYKEENTDLGKLSHQCDEGCPNCLDSCINLPAETPEGWSRILDVNDRIMLVDNRLLGLAAYTNSDGVYAVTEQVRNFLQGFSVSQRYFADGTGWVEQHQTYKVDAAEDEQWLFACGYYKKIN